MYEKIVLVTGCSQGGIGFALCEEFASRGCKVYATARRIEAMEGFKHDSIERLQLDVTLDENVADVVKCIIKNEGRIDIVVNNAGVMCHGPVIDVDMDHVHTTFETNTLSIIRMSKEVIPYMAARRSGTIVNISSIIGETHTPFSGVYAATKSSVKALSEVLYMECLPFNVNVVYIAPGAVKSNVVANHLRILDLPSDSIYSPWRERILRRIELSQGAASMPTELFAEKVVRAVLKDTPPRYMVLGGHARWFSFLGRWPRGYLLRYLWRTHGGDPPQEHKLAADSARQSGESTVH
ncbi:NAD-P-binding protein [Obba rivulosa]|uniref:NAD-P-binding protein n=1 Tax=Obba rivulosa TaxID=1052685 RepID=A0A8E2J6H9_9APHY|nr:NAD-P-binding protein [Obba rivulosa]